MDWLRIHPYAGALGAAGILIVGGTVLVVIKATGAPAVSQTVAWGGAGAVLNPSYTPSTANPGENTVGIMQQVQSDAPYTYIIPAPQTTNTDTQTVSDGFDFNAFISMLSSGQGGPASGTVASGGGATDAYALIPGGLISTSTQTVKRTKLQDSLYNYGNDVGSLVQSFEQEHPDETHVLTDQAQDRADLGKAAGVQAIAVALSSLGDGMLAMDSVPSQVSDAHAALAQSYKDMGQKLAGIPRAQSDADFIAAVESYDTSVETFTKNYVALANLFAAYGVVFSQNDPGNVFTFTPTGL